MLRLGSKRGDITVLRMIIGVVLALTSLFFFMSCVSNLPLFSSVLEPNFQEFVEVTKSLKVGENKAFLLSLPEHSAIVYFEPEAEKVRLTVDDSTSSNYDVVFARDDVCGVKKGCLCLFSETRVTEEGTFNGNSQAMVTSAKKNRCVQDFTFPLKVTSCNFGKAKDVVSYQCQGGFVLERLVAKQARDEVKIGDGDGHYELFGKTEFLLEKKADGVYIGK